MNQDQDRDIREEDYRMRKETTRQKRRNRGPQKKLTQNNISTSEETGFNEDPSDNI